MGKYVDMVLAFETKQLSTGLMWLVMIMYAFQIYYDFSGYSDMLLSTAWQEGNAKSPLPTIRLRF